MLWYSLKCKNLTPKNVRLMAKNLLAKIKHLDTIIITNGVKQGDREDLQRSCSRISESKELQPCWSLTLATYSYPSRKRKTVHTLHFHHTLFISAHLKTNCGIFSPATLLHGSLITLKVKISFDSESFYHLSAIPSPQDHKSNYLSVNMINLAYLLQVSDMMLALDKHLF